MAALFGVVAFLIALLGFIVTLVNGGYLTMLSSAASRRGLSGEVTSDYVRSQRIPAGLLGAAALLGLICTTSGADVVELIGLVLGGGAGYAGYRALQGTRQHFRGDL
jgi:hypothetical protein